MRRFVHSTLTHWLSGTPIYYCTIPVHSLQFPPLPVFADPDGAASLSGNTFPAASGSPGRPALKHATRLPAKLVAHIKVSLSR